MVPLTNLSEFTCDSVNYPSLVHSMFTRICVRIFLNIGYRPLFLLLFKTSSIKNLKYKDCFRRRSNNFILLLISEFCQLTAEVCLVLVKRYFKYKKRSSVVFLEKIVEEEYKTSALFISI